MRNAADSVLKSSDNTSHVPLLCRVAASTLSLSTANATHVKSRRNTSAKGLTASRIEKYPVANLPGY
jgi:hypothetical protein